MNLAQIPQSTPDQLGNWIVAAAAVLAIALLVKQLFFPTKPVDSEYVTKKELKESQNELFLKMELRLSSFEEKFLAFEHKTNRHCELEAKQTDAFQRDIKDLSMEVKLTNQYVHERYHDVLNAVNAIALKLEVYHSQNKGEMSTLRASMGREQEE